MKTTRSSRRSIKSVDGDDLDPSRRSIDGNGPSLGLPPVSSLSESTATKQPERRQRERKTRMACARGEIYSDVVRTIRRERAGREKEERWDRQRARASESTIPSERERTERELRQRASEKEIERERE